MYIGPCSVPLSITDAQAARMVALQAENQDTHKWQPLTRTQRCSAAHILRSNLSAPKIAFKRLKAPFSNANFF
jgi:hypothetical protein